MFNLFPPALWCHFKLFLWSLSKSLVKFSYFNIGQTFLISTNVDKMTHLYGNSSEFEVYVALRVTYERQSTFYRHSNSVQIESTWILSYNKTLKPSTCCKITQTVVRKRFWSRTCSMLKNPADCRTRHRDSTSLVLSTGSIPLLMISNRQSQASSLSSSTDMWLSSRFTNLKTQKPEYQRAPVSSVCVSQDHEAAVGSNQPTDSYCYTDFFVFCFVFSTTQKMYFVHRHDVFKKKRIFHKYKVTAKLICICWCQSCQRS